MPDAIHLALWFVGAYFIGQALLVGVGSVACRVVEVWSPKDELQEKIFGGRRPTLLGRFSGYLLETYFQWIGTFWNLLGLIRLLPALPKIEMGTPVVLLPGYTETGGALYPFAKWLLSRGFRVTLVTFPSTYRAIRKNIEYLKNIVDELRLETGEQRIALVGHSMGGLVARAYVHDSQDKDIAVVVCFGSPHRGSAFAYLGLGGAVRDMTPTSAHIQRHNAHEPSSTPVHNIVGLQEDVVAPCWSCMCSEGDTHVLDQVIGHIGSLFLTEGQERAERWLLENGVLRASDTPTAELAADQRPAA